MNKREVKRHKKAIQEEIRNNYCFDKMVKVNDGENWCPCYPNHEVSVHLALHWDVDTNHGMARISIWGLDDTGVAKELRSSNLDELKDKWQEYKKFYDNIPMTTNMKYYKDRGFIYC